MSGGFNLDDYVDVAERIRLFYEKYPDGRLATTQHSTYEIGDRTFVWCHAYAYRTPDDPQPCSGTAWEPIPGPTPYTRDSELMNAETAAWGRAIIAAGIPSRKIASQQEVQSRQPAPSSPVADAVTKAQHSKIGAVIKQLEADTQPIPDGTETWVDYSRGWIEREFGKTSRADLTKAEAGKLIDHLEAQEVPF